MPRKRSIREVDMVPDVCAPVSYTAPVHAPASYAWRGRILRLEMVSFEELVGRALDAEMITYFCPDAEHLTGRSVEWLEGRCNSIRQGRGCAQSTFATLIPVFWRLPRIGWPVTIPKPPSSHVCTYPIRLAGSLYVQRQDGSFLPLLPTQSKEAA